MDFIINGFNAALEEWSTKKLVLALLQLFWIEIMSVLIVGSLILFKFHSVIWAEILNRT